MSIAWPLFTTTPVYNQCAIRFPQSGSIGEIEIPLHITKFVSPTSAPVVTEITYGSVIDPTSNLSSGGTTLFQGANQINILQMEGWVDTPYFTFNQNANEVAVPSIVIDGNRVTYGEIMAAYFEGRTSLNNAGYWQLTRPRWFRDNYGRVYSTCQIYDLTVQRLEAVPFRNNFTMSLLVS